MQLRIAVITNTGSNTVAITITTVSSTSINRTSIIMLILHVSPSVVIGTNSIVLVVGNGGHVVVDGDDVLASDVGVISGGVISAGVGGGVYCTEWFFLGGQ